MAILKSKQLNPNLTGSYVLSGSSQTLYGTTTIFGETTISGSASLRGSSADLRVRQDDNTTLIKLETDPGGSSALLLYDNKYHSAANTIDINSNEQNALIIKSGSSTIFTVDRDNTLISGSSTSTGSFGRVETSGDIAASGNISSSANITGNVVNVKTRVKAIGSSLEFAGNTLDFVDGSSTTRLFKGTSAGAFEAYHAGNKKLETAAGGINVTGHITASGNISASGTIYADNFTSTGGDVAGISFADDLNITGHITASGNISGSSVSTGSFGTIQTTTGTIPTLLVDTIAFNTTGLERLRITSDGKISGSAVTTGSFGQLETSDVITVGANKEIYLNKSEDTYIQSMAGDIARIVAGGFQMLLLDKDTGKRAVFGNGVKVYIGADNTKQPDKELVVDGDISGSFTSTGSFGTLETAGEINASGRIYEAGSSVIDHATAMAIVFGG